MSPYNRSLHPSESALLRFFDASHLPGDLRAVSEPFGDLAAHIVNSAESGGETTTALRKLLEAKDCAVRAALP